MARTAFTCRSQITPQEPPCLPATLLWLAVAGVVVVAAAAARVACLQELLQSHLPPVMRLLWVLVVQQAHIQTQAAKVRLPFLMQLPQREEEAANTAAL